MDKNRIRGIRCRTSGQVTRSPKRRTESPAIGEQWMEKVCEAGELQAGMGTSQGEQRESRRGRHDCSRSSGMMRSVTRFITRKLKLKGNEQKSAVARPWERKFLGFSFTGGATPRRRIAPKAVLRFKERVRERTSRTRGVSIDRMAEELARYLRGWLGYYGHCETPSVLQRLEEWTRRRLRSAMWKQWKRGTTRFAELRTRGGGQGPRR